MEDIKVGDCVIITNLKKNNGEWNPHYNGEISVIDKIDYPFYYLENDNTTPFTKEQLRVISTKNKFNMIKCKKCGSANVKVDFNQVYTSLPAMYGYVCQDCGEDGYVNCSDVYMSNFTSDGFQTYPSPDINITNGANSVPNVEDKKEPKVENNGGLLGWICPKCGRCYSPFTTMCSFCNNDGGNCITATYKNTL